jgi:hypothetical protein
MTGTGTKFQAKPPNNLMSMQVKMDQNNPEIETDKFISIYSFMTLGQI